MKKAWVSVFNSGLWPKHVIWMDFEFLPFNGKWHLIGVDCFGTDDTFLGGYPRWALTPEMEKVVEQSRAQLPLITHP